MDDLTKLGIKVWADIAGRKSTISLIKENYRAYTKESVEEELLPHRIELRILWEIYNEIKRIQDSKRPKRRRG